MADKLRAIQLDALDVLKELDRVCKELDIPYFLTAGTLLGAVRHKGFIPWDDDVDVVMRRADYEAFARRCPAVLKADYFYQDHRTHPGYPLGFAKLRKHGTQVSEKILAGAEFEMGAFVDIFPLDVCPDGELLGRLFFYGNNILNYALIKRCNPSFEIDNKRAISRLLWRAACLLPNGCLTALRDFWRRLAQVFSSGRTLCTVSGRHGYPREVYPAQWFSEGLDLEFEGRRFPAPKEWPALLAHMYGDYWTPVQESGGHLL